MARTQQTARKCGPGLKKPVPKMKRSSSSPAQADSPSSAAHPPKRRLSPIEPENSEAAEADTSPRPEIPFSIHNGQLPPDRAYLVKHHDEAPESHGTRWQQAKNAYTIVNQRDHAFQHGDIIRVSFEKPPGGYARIVDLKHDGETFAVIQWLYTKAEAVRSGLKPAAAKLWPAKTYMFSNHFQVITGSNIERTSDVTVSRKSYLNTSVHGKLGTWEVLESLLVYQLTRINPE